MFCCPELKSHSFIGATTPGGQRIPHRDPKALMSRSGDSVRARQLTLHLPWRAPPATGRNFEVVMECQRQTLAELERTHILAILYGCGGNRTRAAQTLGISVRCLRNKLRQYRADGCTVPEQSQTRRQRQRASDQNPVAAPVCF